MIDGSKMSNKKWDLRFLSLAKLVSTWSHDPSTKVGAVIALPNHHVVSVGFNGFPASMPDKEEWYIDRSEKYERVVHAEVNALIFANTPLPKDPILYTYPFIPCNRCVVQMLQANIFRFVSYVPSPDTEKRWGDDFFKTRQYIKECGGELVELPNNTYFGDL